MTVRSCGAGIANAAYRRIARWKTGPPRLGRNLSDLAIVASLARSNGIANGARLQVDAMARAGLRPRLIDSRRSALGVVRRQPHCSASAYVFHAAGPETALLLNSVLPEAGRAWRIGYWAWELPSPPREWGPFESLVSEIWTPSRYSANSLAQLFSVPISVVPHYIEARCPRERDYSAPFTVLTMADSRSSLDRKNPEAAVDAFRVAFGDDTRARLIVKLSGRHADMSNLLKKVEDKRNISVLNGILNTESMERLMRSADVLLSLHRAEGFGLPLLEAMAHGIPTVGTAWSGNMEYMNEANSVLIPYELVPVHDGAGIYKADGVWANPDVTVAAESLRMLADDEGFYRRVAASGHDHVRALKPPLFD